MIGQLFCMPGLIQRTVILFLISLLCPACQNHVEPMSSSLALNPKITVNEPPPKPLSNDLVVQQAPPVPMSIASVAITTVEPDTVTAVQPTQPPALITTPLIQPVNYPKQSGIALAFDHFLAHRNDDAIAVLKAYPTEDQDAALVMLPMLARMDQGETWQTLNGPQKLAMLESLRSYVKRLSKSAPLVLQHVTLVDKPPNDKDPSRFGEVKPRSNSNYYTEDWVHAYAELVNLQDFINPEGLYNVRLEVTLELHGLNDQICYQASCPCQKNASIGPRTDFHIPINFNLPKQITPGSYQLVIIVLDRDTNRTARQSLPLQILDPKNKSNASGKRRS